MHARTRELLRHLDQQRAVLAEALAAAPAELRELRPAPERWSVAGVLEHLWLVERRIAVLLGEGLRAAQARSPLPPEPDQQAVLPAIDAERILDRERTVMAGDAVRPRSGVTAGQAWQELQESRRALVAVVTSADGLRTDAIQAHHPFLGQLTFLQWIAFVGFHEARHAAQIRATVAALQGIGT